MGEWLGEHGRQFYTTKTIRDGFEKGEPLSQDIPKHTLTIFDVAFLPQSWQAGHPATGGKGFWHCVSRLVSNPSSPRRIAYEVGSRSVRSVWRWRWFGVPMVIIRVGVSVLGA